MADAVLTSVVARTITIFEGSHGRRKTRVASAVLKALGMRCMRINLSPTMTAEDLFGRDIPQFDPQGGFTIRLVNGPLTNAMIRSCNDNPRQGRPSQTILLDEINLASPQLLEILEVFMLNMSRNCCFSLPKGMEISHHSIVVVATMNNATLSNAGSSLSSKPQGA
jgi:MoxR-like ATPase